MTCIASITPLPSSDRANRPVHVLAGSASAALPVSTSVVQGDWRTDRRVRTARRHSKSGTGVDALTSVQTPFPLVGVAPSGVASTWVGLPVQHHMVQPRASLLDASDPTQVEMFSAVTTLPKHGVAYRSNGFVETTGAARFGDRCRPVYTIRPTVADMTSHRKENRLARPALLTRTHIDQLDDHSDAVDGYGDLLEEVMSDGVIDHREQRLLVIRFMPIQQSTKAIQQGGEVIDASVRFARRALEGDGVYGAWFGQMAREHVRDRAYLRLVVDNTDGPEPDGPVTAKAA